MTEAVSDFSSKTIHGKPPILQQVESLTIGASYLIKRIETLHDQGIPYSEMMLLYASSKHHSAPGASVPVFLREKLEESGILVNWASRNAQSKSAWDITTDSVSLSTIHSMKGLDAKAVFVWGLDALATGDMPLNQQRTIAYVACTRARQYLDIVFCEKTLLINELYNSLLS